MSGVPRSQRLLAFTFTSSGPSPAWSTPANHITLLKSAAFYNSGTATVQVILAVQVLGSGVTVRVVDHQLAAAGVWEWQGWHVLNPGDAFYAYSMAGAVSVWVSGAVLAGGPLFPPATRESVEQQPVPEPAPR